MNILILALPLSSLSREKVLSYKTGEEHNLIGSSITSSLNKSSYLALEMTLP